MIWKEKLDEVTTVESYYMNVIYKNDVIVLPYINAGISDHPLNPTKEHLCVDRSYIVCLKACFKQIGATLFDSCDHLKLEHPKILLFGGVDIEKDRYVELEILCEDAYWETLPDSQIRKESWIPVKTPNSPPNMNANEVKDFFEHKYLPDDIKKLIDDDQ
jgi:hypothetical protein